MHVRDGYKVQTKDASKSSTVQGTQGIALGLRAGAILIPVCHNSSPSVGWIGWEKMWRHKHKVIATVTRWPCLPRGNQWRTYQQQTLAICLEHVSGPYSFWCREQWNFCLQLAYSKACCLKVTLMAYDNPRAHLLGHEFVFTKQEHCWEPVCYAILQVSV